MADTHFANPHGLDDHEDHYSSAYDMALLTKYAMDNDQYKKIAGTEKYRSENPDGKWDRVWKNKNKLLTGLYEYTTGGKTGYTKRAKRTLVSTAEKDGVELIAVTLNDPDDWDDHINMYESAFKEYKMASLLEKGKVKTKDSFYKNKLFIKEDIEYPITDSEKDELEIKFKLSKVKAEWKKKEQNVPDVVGNAEIFLEGKLVESVPIYFEHAKEKENKSFFDHFKSMFLAVMGVDKDG